MVSQETNPSLKNNKIFSFFTKVSNIFKSIIFILLIVPLLVSVAMIANHGLDFDYEGIAFISGICFVCALFYYLAIQGLKSHKTWARVLSIFLSVPWLFLFPVGTIAGGYLIFQLIRKNWKENI